MKSNSKVESSQCLTDTLSKMINFKGIPFLIGDPPSAVLLQLATKWRFQSPYGPYHLKCTFTKYASRKTAVHKNVDLLNYYKGSSINHVDRFGVYYIPFGALLSLILILITYTAIRNKTLKHVRYTILVAVRRTKKYIAFKCIL